MTRTIVAWLCSGTLFIGRHPPLTQCEGWLMDGHGQLQTRFWEPKAPLEHARRVQAERLLQEAHNPAVSKACSKACSKASRKGRGKP